MFGLKGSKNKSSSQSSSQSYIDPAQAPFLDFLRNTGVGVYGGLDMSQLYGAAQGYADQAGQAIASMAGAGAPLANYGNQQAIDAQVAALQDQMGDFYQERLLPGMRRDATGAGQLGMSRDIINREQGAGDVADAVAQGTATIYGNAAQQRLQAAQAQAGATLQAGTSTLSALPGLYTMAAAPYAAQLSPLLQLAQIFSDPTVLQKAQSSSKSSGSSWGIDFGGGWGAGGEGG